MATVDAQLTGLKAGSAVVGAGGLLPTQGITDSSGNLSLAIPLRPGASNRLQFTVISPDGSTQTLTAVVRQTKTRGNYSLSGKVIDISGIPIQGAHVVYGTVSATSDKTGDFTLSRLPTGMVAATVTAPGYTPGVAVSNPSLTSPNAQVKVTLAVLPASLPIGANGADRAGTGWTLSVPAGALPAGTQLPAGPLAASGAIDQLGEPLLQVGTPGLTFAAPVQLTLGPDILGGAVSDPQDVGANDPQTLLPVPAQVSLTSNGGVTVSFSQSAQIRMEPPQHGVRTNLPQCQGYGASDNPQRQLIVARASLYTLTGGGAAHSAWRLWSAYLTPGQASATRDEVGDSQSAEEFAAAPETQAAEQALFNKAVAVVRGLRPSLTSESTKLALEQLGLGHNLTINWHDPTTIPGLIAGSTGGVEIPSLGASFPDTRTITGDLVLKATVDPHGVITNVSLQPADWVLDVNDSIDFCPGDLTGTPNPFWSWAAINIGRTLAMSRLERTLYSGGGTYAKPILWHGLFPLLGPDDINGLSADLTGLYQNDPDHDGWPDTEPWPGATYTLDNCPGVYNPDQTDSDRNGVGDACQKNSFPTQINGMINFSERGAKGQLTFEATGDTSCSPRSCMSYAFFPLAGIWTDDYGDVFSGPPWEYSSGVGANGYIYLCTPGNCPPLSSQAGSKPTLNAENVNAVTPSPNRSGAFFSFASTVWSPGVTSLTITLPGAAADSNGLTGTMTLEFTY